MGLFGSIGNAIKSVGGGATRAIGGAIGGVARPIGRAVGAVTPGRGPGRTPTPTQKLPNGRAMMGRR